MDGRRERRRAPIALDPARAYKPLDVGNGIVAGCVGPDGRLLEAGIARARHGRAVATCAPPFDESRRHDQAAVRRYRAALADPGRPGFGLALAGEAALEDGIPTFRAGGASLAVVAPAGRAGLVQVARGRVGRAEAPWRLERAAYTQLTEGGPLVPSREGLGAVAAAEAPGAYALAFGDTPEAAEAEAAALARDAEALLAAERVRRAGRDRDAGWLLDCASCDVGGAAALLADHVLLPLVWTRDGYWTARALVARGGGPGAAAADAFLAWCFERAERLDGLWWPRSSLATGEPKDRAFQLDQQVYPLLLLAERGGPALARHRAAAEAVLDALVARADGGLVATSETPADDRLEQPFHFSSHVLLWRALVRFGRSEAEPLRRRIRDAFTHDGRFAYAVGAGVRHYHDANDLPTALAPAWGFCEATDPHWRATVAYGWSGENEGYFAGERGGLGSLHTPHPWPLGDLQRVVVARAAADAAAEREAWERLDRVATWDGLLPEAYDERDGGVASRHWFAWPVAVRALLAARPRAGGATAAP